MGLSEQEARTLQALLKKKDEPDAPPVGKSINVTIDLGDAKQVERAQKLGLLGMIQDGDDDDDSGGDGDDDKGDVPPKRKGYFD